MQEIISLVNILEMNVISRECYRERIEKQGTISEEQLDQYKDLDRRVFWAKEELISLMTRNIPKSLNSERGDSQ